MIDSRLFFMLGAPRSGTTILFHILNLHPKCFVSNEWAIPELVSHLNHYTHRRPHINKDFMYDLLVFFYRKHSLHKPTAHYFGDKHPAGYCFYNVLRAHFHWMLLIETWRNPYEQVASGIQRIKNKDGWSIDWKHHLAVMVDSFDTHRKAEREGVTVPKVKMEDLLADSNKVLIQLCREMDVPAGEQFLKDAKYLIKPAISKIDLLSKEQISFINKAMGDRIEQMGYQKLNSQ